MKGVNEKQQAHQFIKSQVINIDWDLIKPGPWRIQLFLDIPEVKRLRLF